MSDTDMCGCKDVNVINSLDNDTSRTEHNVRERVRVLMCTVVYSTGAAQMYTLPVLYCTHIGGRWCYVGDDG